MHDIVELAKTLRHAIVERTARRTQLTAINEVHPPYRTYAVQVRHENDDGEPDDLGTRYVVTVNGDKCEVHEVGHITPKIDWVLRIGEDDDEE